MTCITCQHWRLKTSPMARNGLATCVHLPRYEYLPPQHTCQRHQTAAPEITAARIKWLSKSKE